MQLHLRNKEQKYLESMVTYKKIKTTPKSFSMYINTDDKAEIQ